MHTRPQLKGGGCRGLEKADAKQKLSNLRKMQGEQLRPCKIGVILHPSLAEKGRPGLHACMLAYTSAEPSLKLCHPPHPHPTPTLASPSCTS